LIKKRLKVKRIKRKNKKLIPYINGDRLPAWRFFKIIEKCDYRFLLKVKELPRFYDTGNLLQLYDRITKKLDEISGKDEFKDAIEESKKSILEKNKLVGLESIFSLMKYNDKQTIEDLKYYGISVPDLSIKSINKVHSAIRRERTRINMNRIADSEMNKAVASGNISFNQAIIQTSNLLKREINWKKISINEWYYLQAEIDKMLAEMKKRKHHAENY